MVEKPMTVARVVEEVLRSLKLPLVLRDRCRLWEMNTDSFCEMKDIYNYRTQGGKVVDKPLKFSAGSTYGNKNGGGSGRGGSTNACPFWMDVMTEEELEQVRCVRCVRCVRYVRRGCVGGCVRGLECGGA